MVGMRNPNDIINKKRAKNLTLNDVPQITVKKLILILLKKGILNKEDLE